MKNSTASKIRKILLSTLEYKNRPQLISAPILSKRVGGAREVCNKAIANLRKSGMVNCVGFVNDSPLYGFNRTAKKWIDAHGDKVLTYWLNHGAKWDQKFLKYTDKDFKPTSNLLKDLGFDMYGDYIDDQVENDEE